MKTIRFGIVGTGNIAHRFAQACKNVEGASLVAVASRKKETAEGFGDEFGIEYRFDSYEKMAQSDVIDAAYIAVPHSLHKEASILMMNHGKAVLCEKPLTLNERDAREMFACAEKNGVFFMEAMWARLVPGTLKMLELVKNGVLGEIMGVEGKFCYTMDEDEMDHHVLKREYGGGSLLDVGVYGLNFASWYLGEDVEAINAQCSLREGVDTHLQAIIKYKSGAIADISSAILLKKPNEGCVYGTKGYAYLKRFYAPQEIELHIDGAETEVIKVPYAGNGFEEQIAHMCDCIRNGLIKSPVNTPEQTLFITRQSDSIRRMCGISYPQDEN